MKVTFGGETTWIASSPILRFNGQISRFSSLSPMSASFPHVPFSCFCCEYNIVFLMPSLLYFSLPLCLSLCVFLFLCLPVRLCLRLSFPLLPSLPLSLLLNHCHCHSYFSLSFFRSFSPYAQSLCGLKKTASLLSNCD